MPKDLLPSREAPEQMLYMIIINDCHITKDLFRNISNLVIIEITDCAIRLDSSYTYTRTAPGAGESRAREPRAKKIQPSCFHGTVPTFLFCLRTVLKRVWSDP
jgi:hypothetical protein